MNGPALVLCSSIIAGGLLLAPVSALAGPAGQAVQRARGQPVEAVLLRPQQVDDAELLDALQLRSPQREIAVPPWPARSEERFGLFAVATVLLTEGTLDLTLVLSDGRAYYRTLDATADGAPRLAASTLANLLAAIEEDELPPDEENVALPAEQAEPEPEPAPEPEPMPEPEPTPERVVTREPPLPWELEPIVGGHAAVSLGPPSPAGFAGGGGVLGLELRSPRAVVVGLALRSHWHRPGALTIGRTRISVGGGYAWRRERFELRSVVGVDLEPWGVRRGGTRQPVTYPDGLERRRGLQLGGHVRLVPSFRAALGPSVGLRVGPRLELAGSGLLETPGVARLLVADATGQRSVEARVGGLELSVGIELGVAWSLPNGRVSEP